MFCTVAVISMALGIGANTAIFSLLDQVVLRSLPVHDPETLVVLHRQFRPNGTSSADNSESVFSYPMYRDLRDGDAALDGLVARMSAAVRVAWRGSTEAERAELVSGNFFQVLGVGSIAGRTLVSADEGAPGANPVAVLGYGYWMSRFAASRDVIGKTIAINGLPFTVIGVADSRFHGLLQGDAANLFVPITMQRAITPTLDILQDRQFRWLNLFGRLKPGEGIAQAQAATAVAYHRILQSEAATLSGIFRSDRGRQEFLNHTLELRPAAQGISALREKWESPLRVLMAMVGLVLLIACANVAGLLIARATGRRREISIRLAIGAGRGAILKQLLIEGLVLSLAGGTVALGVERWSTGALLRILPQDAFQNWISSGLDARLFLFTFALACISGVLFALAPALQASRTDIAISLRTQSANVAGGGPPRLRQILVVAQVCLSMLLAIGAGLFVASAGNLLRASLGFRSQNLLVFDINATLDRPKAPDALAFYRDLRERLSAIPGVTGVAAANNGLFGGGSSSGNITVEGYHARENEETDSQRVAVGPGFFHALGITLRAGRDLSERDESATSTSAVVVNEAFVKRYLPNQNPIGKRFMSGASNHPVFNLEIVGVAADSRSEPRATVKPTYYFPYASWTKPDRLTFFVRSAGDSNNLPAAIRNVAHAADADLPVGDIRTADLDIRDSLYTERLVAVLAAAFGILAMLLAAIGLYGVTAYAVARRTGEIGVRMALGAMPASVIGMVLKSAGRLVVPGIVLGWIAAFALGRFVEAELYGVHAADFKIYAAATAVLLGAALLAALVPGWRAAHIDPVVALKYE
jgi:predicted permease